MLIRSSSLMIINSASFKFDCHLYCHGGFSLCVILCMQVIKDWKREEERLEDQDSLGSCLDSNLYFFLLYFIFFFTFRL
jgi:hypothetical protein